MTKLKNADWELILFTLGSVACCLLALSIPFLIGNVIIAVEIVR